MWYAIVAILILIADQGLKYWVTLNIPLDTGHVTLIPGVLELTNIHNNGAAFSILQHAPHWIFVIFTVVFAAIAVFCLRRNVVHGKIGRWSVVLVLAGAVGNCIDRILSGYVVDMFNFLFVRFAVFNLADIFIVVAGIALCLHVIFYRGDGSEDAPAPKKARKPRKRVGRGPASGTGKTSGRGMNGQKSRAGGGKGAGFEGGQTPLARRLPKLPGFRNFNRVEYLPVNVSRLDAKFEAGDVVDGESLKAKGIIKHADALVKVLGDGEITKALTVRVDKVSASAKAKIEAAGGKVEEPC